MFGTSDPYAVLLGLLTTPPDNRDLVSWGTTGVAKNDLNPVWGESFVVSCLGRVPARAGGIKLAPMVVRVFDHDDGIMDSTDDHLGTVTIPWNLLFPPHGSEVLLFCTRVYLGVLGCTCLYPPTRPAPQSLKPVLKEQGTVAPTRAKPFRRTSAWRATTVTPPSGARQARASVQRQPWRSRLHRSQRALGHAGLCCDWRRRACHVASTPRWWSRRCDDDCDRHRRLWGSAASASLRSAAATTAADDECAGAARCPPWRHVDRASAIWPAAPGGRASRRHAGDAFPGRDPSGACGSSDATARRADVDGRRRVK